MKIENFTKATEIQEEIEVLEQHRKIITNFETSVFEKYYWLEAGLQRMALDMSLLSEDFLTDYIQGVENKILQLKNEFEAL